MDRFLQKSHRFSTFLRSQEVIISSEAQLAQSCNSIIEKNRALSSTIYTTVNIYLSPSFLAQTLLRHLAFNLLILAISKMLSYSKGSLKREIQRQCLHVADFISHVSFPMYFFSLSFWYPYCTSQCAFDAEK